MNAEKRFQRRAEMRGVERYGSVEETALSTTRHGNTGLGGWRRLGMFWAIVIVVSGVAAAFLELLGPPGVQAVPAYVAQAVKPAQSGSAESAVASDISKLLPGRIATLGAPVQPSAGDPNPTGETLTKPSGNSTAAVAAPPPDVDTDRPSSAASRAPLQAIATPATPPPTATAETDKPILRLYYARGSSVAEANARNLAAQVGSSIASFDIQVQADMPRVAVMRFSEARNHPLVRAIAPSLSNLGYAWRIENVPDPDGVRRNTVEIWLPAK